MYKDLVCPPTSFSTAKDAQVTKITKKLLLVEAKPGALDPQALFTLNFQVNDLSQHGIQETGENAQGKHTAHILH